MRAAIGVFVGILIVGRSTQILAEESSTEFFEKKIRPALVTYCYECHSADSKKLGGQLLLDNREGVRSGGDSGPAIVIGTPDESLLIKAIRYTDDSVKMPPKGKLPDSVIADLEFWVKDGAADPRDQPSRPKSNASWERGHAAERADWWSLRPLSTSKIPDISDGPWSANLVDRFVASKLAEKGLTPARADRRTHTGSSVESCLDRIAADDRTSRSICRRMPGRLRLQIRCRVRSSKDLSIRYCNRRISANTGRGTGWMLSGSRKRTATSGITKSITPGGIATT